MRKIMIITIDGPAGTGKTTIAKKLAEKLGFQYFDTGAMYRAVTYLIIKKGIDPKDSGSLKTFFTEFKFDIRSEKNQKRYIASGEDVTEKIRENDITSRVSEIAANPFIRQMLVTIQREFGRGKNSIFEGRDMGTIVFPDAGLKIYLTARPAVRAERRYLELKEKNEKSLISEEKVMKELLERDHFDSTREASPLKQAEDAHLIDTSDLTIEQVVDQILTLIAKKT